MVVVIITVVIGLGAYCIPYEWKGYNVKGVVVEPVIKNGVAGLREMLL